MRLSPWRCGKMAWVVFLLIGGCLLLLSACGWSGSGKVPNGVCVEALPVSEFGETMVLRVEAAHSDGKVITCEHGAFVPVDPIEDQG